jgi:hypothetical protein
MAILCFNYYLFTNNFVSKGSIIRTSIIVLFWTKSVQHCIYWTMFTVELYTKFCLNLSTSNLGETCRETKSLYFSVTCF